MSTTGIVLIEEHAQRVKPPRMLAVPFFFGNALGEANDAEYQHRVLQHTFDLLDRNAGPVLESLPDDMIPDILMQGSETTNESDQKALNVADELTALRAYYEQWTKAHMGRTSVGLSTVPQRRFRGIVHFIEGYVSGEESDMKERPAEFAVPQFFVTVWTTSRPSTTRPGWPSAPKAKTVKFTTGSGRRPPWAP